ncbi:anhydro-N-acetylmuramic acid kinase [Aureimonas sp. Leaf460]|nr:anhydro-N-acetylmuramic acid kinase [Aureimonas sp. Leaf427]KQT79484.1 anhydro-N-acetylmuramic acid kinase [Aureimonas sp. Leaf460]
MSGTSMDGIDVALVKTDGESIVERGPSAAYPLDAAFRRRLEAGLEDAKAIVRRGERPGDLANLEREITDLHADAVRAFARETGIDLGTVDLVGFHGQTVLHRPAERLTVQLGDGPRLAAALGRPVVHDMRAADVAAGGQGAPLVPAYHAALAAGLAQDLRREPVVFVNIGGISNVTYIDGAGDPIAFDSGPGNALLDRWVQNEVGISYDQGGAIAAEGGILDELAAAYLGSPFFAKPAPKSLDRFDFPMPPAGSGSLEDVARTLCFVAAQAILKSAEHMPKAPKLWIICGGGRKHPAILGDLVEGAGSDARVMTAEEAGFDGDAMEAEAWAYLAVRSARGLALTFPTTTGAPVAMTGGLIAWP